MPSPLCPSESVVVDALRLTVATLGSRCSVLPALFNTIDTSIDTLVTQQANTTTTLNNLVKSPQVLITSVTARTERLDEIASHFEKLDFVAPRKTLSRPCICRDALSVPVFCILQN